MNASDICAKASELVGGDRADTHGDKLENHENIGALWNAYLRKRLMTPLAPADVAIMMSLLKIARTQAGTFNLDDFVDGSAYIAIAGDILTRES